MLPAFGALGCALAAEYVWPIWMILAAGIAACWTGFATFRLTVTVLRTVGLQMSGIKPTSLRHLRRGPKLKAILAGSFYQRIDMTTAIEPVWLRHARSLIGTREAAGAANSSTIMGWAKKLGTKVFGMVYNADSGPWCGLFVVTCLAEDGIPAAPIAARAKAWATRAANLAADRLAPDVVLVFDRVGGGHVGFYVGEDQTSYYFLGGSQGDRVSIMRV